MLRCVLLRCVQGACMLRCVLPGSPMVVEIERCSSPNAFFLMASVCWCSKMALSYSASSCAHLNAASEWLIPGACAARQVLTKGDRSAPSLAAARQRSGSPSKAEGEEQEQRERRAKKGIEAPRAQQRSEHGPRELLVRVRQAADDLGQGSEGADHHCHLGMPPAQVADQDLVRLVQLLLCLLEQSQRLAARRHPQSRLRYLCILCQPRARVREASGV